MKAKLAAVADGITTFESEFMADTAMPDGSRFADVALPAIESAYKAGTAPVLRLTGPAGV